MQVAFNDYGGAIFRRVKKGKSKMLSVIYFGLGLITLICLSTACRRNTGLIYAEHCGI